MASLRRHHGNAVWILTRFFEITRETESTCAAELGDTRCSLMEPPPPGTKVPLALFYSEGWFLSCCSPSPVSLQPVIVELNFTASDGGSFLCFSEWSQMASTHSCGCGGFEEFLRSPVALQSG